MFKLLLEAHKGAPVRERRVRGSLNRAETTKTKVKETYEEIRKLGEGGQGKLWIVKRKSDMKILVRKDQKRFSMFGSLPTEVHIFEKILTHHPRIIEFDHANYIEANGTLVLYFEHCRGGDLHDYLPRRGEKGMSERFLWQCFVQLADAIAFLHYGYNRFSKHPDDPPRGWARVIHRDIKPENVFLRRKITSSDPVPEVVLGDFGLATLQSESYGSGTAEWMAPEVPIVTKEGDVWGVGAIIHALAHGRGPVPSPPRDWPGGRLAEDRWYADPQARRPKQLPSAYSSALNHNMMNCLVKDPSKRVNTRDLIDDLVAERPRPRR